MNRTNKTQNSNPSTDLPEMVSCFGRIKASSCQVPSVGGFFIYKELDMNAKEKLREKRILKDINKTTCCSSWKYQEFDSNPKYVIWMCVVFIASMLMLIAGCFVARPAHADQISDKDAILAVIGEAEDQLPKGMLAVSCAIRNRGTLKGVYGLHAPRVVHHKYSKGIYELAKQAWEQSAYRDITHGATHWENINAFGCPSWAKGCVEVFRYKDHVFYKEA